MTVSTITPDVYTHNDMPIPKLNWLNLNIGIDYDPQDPTEFGEGWKVVSFGNRHTNYEDPYNYTDDSGERWKIGLRNKFKAGTAFVLSYFEHGLCRWMLAGSDRGLMAGDWRWDGVDVAGLLIWEGKPTDLGKNYTEREERARSFIDTYTDYCNGNVWCYAVEDEHGEHLDSCCGYFGDDVKSGVTEYLEYYMKQCGLTKIEYLDKSEFVDDDPDSDSAPDVPGVLYVVVTGEGKGYFV